MRSDERLFVCPECLHERTLFGYNIIYPILCRYCGASMKEQHVYHPPEKEERRKRLLNEVDYYGDRKDSSRQGS